MLLRATLSLIPLICNVVTIAVASSIETFSDTSCQDAYSALNGPNGYPNGTCTQLKEQGTFGSFQVVQEDTGCAVTIYGSDADKNSPCSSNVKEIAEIAKCYNTSWVYYSIDECMRPASSSTSLPTSAPSSHHSNHAGAIAGGVVGGVAGVAALNALGWFFFIRHRHQRQQQQQQEQSSGQRNRRLQELGGGGVRELPDSAKEPQYELQDTKKAQPEGPTDPQYLAELPAVDNAQAEEARKTEDSRQETSPPELQGDQSWHPGRP